MAVTTDQLNVRLPNGQGRYVALLTTLPNSDGVGAVEVTGAGYARVPHSAWIDETIGGLLYRKNDGTVEFGELTAPVTGVVGWAIYSAITGGTLMAFGPIVGLDGEDKTRNLAAQDVPRFLDQDMMIGGSATIGARSFTGQAWTLESAAAASTWLRVVWSPELSLFAALAESGASRMMTSPDGETWTPQTVNANDWLGLCWSPELGLFCAVSYDGTHRIAISADGETWTPVVAPAANGWSDVCWAAGLGLFVAIADSGAKRVMTSPDGTNWTLQTAATADSWSRVAWSPELSLLVAVANLGGTGNTIMTSPDGENWTPRAHPVEVTTFADVYWAAPLSCFIALGYFSGIAAVSADGMTWSSVTIGGDSWRQVVWGSGYLVAVGDAGVNRVAYSFDGETWSLFAPAQANEWEGLCFAPELNLFVAVAYSGTDRVMRMDALVINVGCINGESAELDIVDERSLPKSQALLPPGLAWPRDADAELTQLTRALSYEPSRISKRVLDFFDELDPRTCTEMLEDFERVYGLPLDGTGPATVAARRAALHAKMFGYVDPSKPNMIALAAKLGYAIVITEYKYTDMFSCVSACNAALRTRQWMYLWRVTTPSGDNDAVFEAALAEVCPDHTVLDITFT